jgi:hypothetical protein
LGQRLVITNVSTVVLEPIALLEGPGFAIMIVTMNVEDLESAYEVGRSLALTVVRPERNYVAAGTLILKYLLWRKLQKASYVHTQTLMIRDTASLMSLFTKPL